jgi:CDP-glucose 4,6-dehydratase
VISVRAGNVIGGGDFAENRLLPDLIRAYQGAEKLTIRNLDSTRPWQHVLDPLMGYLMCLETKIDSEKLTSINFGPTEKSLTVRDVITIGSKILNHDFLSSDEQLDSQYVQDLESRNLQLNSNKANNLLQWQPAWSQVEGISATFRWWERVLLQGDPPGMAINEDIVYALNKLGSRPNTGRAPQDNLLD